jgi:hypothetical protein
MGKNGGHQPQPFEFENSIYFLIFYQDYRDLVKAYFSACLYLSFE